MQILVLLGMYFDATVVFVKTFLLLFRLALVILSSWEFALQETWRAAPDKFLLMMLNYIGTAVNIWSICQNWQMTVPGPQLRYS